MGRDFVYTLCPLQQNKIYTIIACCTWGSEKLSVWFEVAQWVNGQLRVWSQVLSSKAFASSFPRGCVWGSVCGFPAWWLLAWQPVLSCRASLGTLTMPWGPSSTTTPSGSNLVGLPEFYNIPQGYTVEKREGYPLRPGKQHLWPMASSQPLILQTPNPQHLYEVPCLTNAHSSTFFPHLLLPVTLGGFPARNSISLLFSEKEIEAWLVAMASPRLLGVGARTGTQVSSLHPMLFSNLDKWVRWTNLVDAFWAPATGISDA